jgi:ribonuclease T1
MMRSSSRRLFWSFLFFLSLLFCTSLVLSKGIAESTRANQIADVALADLPQQGRETYLLIVRGGPFPYEKDGVGFGNRERLLPVHDRGYYREYTVRTPGVKSRGARRIACGGPVRKPDVCYYSDDHYASFRKIVP